MLLGTQDMVDVGQQGRFKRWVGCCGFLVTRLLEGSSLSFLVPFLDMPAAASSLNQSIAQASDSAAVDKAPDSAANLGAAVSQELQRTVFRHPLAY